MLDWLWLIPALPLTGFVVLALAGFRMPKWAIAATGVGSIALGFAASLVVAIRFFVTPPADFSYTQILWRWIPVGNFQPTIGFRLDALSLVMVLVVAGVALLIHLYASASMRHEPGYARFFAYMNLFVASMLTLLLADNLLLLYLGWEGVGLCSYLLIGFWYEDEANGIAAQKAFIVTRIGDVSLAVGIFLLFTQLGTLDLHQILAVAPAHFVKGGGLALAAALLLLGGAVGKSAQLPLQTWLPDAMAGPTPVSALIHAATMVTAGVYLIARTHTLFELAPAAELAVAAIGAATLLLAGVSALFQRDIKRVLAYSTISQIGYMFLALGVGAWSAAILHFMTHAFFKSLLFLAAGVVIDALHHEHDIYKMGGLRRSLPVAFWTFLIAGASLSGVPIVTAGFYSKDWILDEAWSLGAGGPWLWAAGLVGALLTAIYIFRVIFLVFFGEQKQAPQPERRGRIPVVLIILAVLSIIGGLLEVPRTLGGLSIFSRFLGTALPAGRTLSPGLEASLELIAALAAFGGIAIAWALYLRHPKTVDAMARAPIGRAFGGFFARGWGFETLYEWLVVRPYHFLARLGRPDFIDEPYRGIALTARALHHGLSKSENGRLRWYAAAVGGGAAILVAILVFA
ncbi:MAG: NADH-quinone oxidoreductase subunit L [Polyangia bacterium]